MLIEESLDTGPTLLRREVTIPSEITCGELEAQLATLGAELIVPTLEGLMNKTLQPKVQDHRQATLAPKVSKMMARIDWTSSASAIHNQIRAFNPWPLAYSEFRNRKLQVFRSRVALASSGGDGRAAGSVVDLTKGGCVVRCGDGELELLEVQLSGRSRISGRDFASGARLSRGEAAFAVAAQS